MWILLSGYHFCLIQTCLGTCLKGSPIYSFRTCLKYDLFVHVPRVLNVMIYIQMLVDFFFPHHSCHVLIKQVWYLVFFLELDSSAPPRGVFFSSPPLGGADESSSNMGRGWSTSIHPFIPTINNLEALHPSIHPSRQQMIGEWLLIHGSLKFAVGCIVSQQLVCLPKFVHHRNQVT